MHWLVRLSRRVDAIEARSLARTRERIGSDTRPAGPDGRIGRGVVIWLAILVYPMVVAVRGDDWLAAAGVLAMAAAMTAAMLLPPAGGYQLLRYVLLVPLLVLTLLLGRDLDSTSGLLVVLPSQAAAMVLPLTLPALAGVVVVSALCIAVLGGHAGMDYSAVATAVTMSGFAMFLMRRVFTTINLLREAREELARAAVADERVRFARDLHDLLGHTLSVIVVKAQVVRRLADRDAGQAAAAAADIEAIGRQALVEVREAVTGYRQRSLAAELDSARTALADAGITPVVRRASGELDERADDLLGWAVREGTTNVIRHSAATHCTISLRYDADRVVLRIADDGTGGAGSVAGNGLRGLSERFDAAGGTVHTAATRHGFTLTATVPVTVGRMDP